ncbi:Pentatricopeptide repeat-containing protein, mitochondrial [Sesamum angolense]|uniref:Pentatricopeptide repeat-containing protein, mitochondrial n=1 Tax=Sesamum angolense TaxID=2727404 RepID=A0AAE2BQ60_9LAMI|nr:Pentatricopeptide repeat-containing protein, mitochondrial [Sesamum angolense]
MTAACASRLLSHKADRAASTERGSVSNEKKSHEACPEKIHGGIRPSSSKIDPSRKRHHNHHISTAPNFPTDNHVTPHRNSHQQVMDKRSSFISYSEVSSLPPKVKILCEIIARTPAVTVERVLEDTGVRVSEEDVEEVLKLSYGYPGSAVKFFRWSSFQLNKHSPYAWNLVVDLLGKNCLFDAMWDAIKSMKKEQLLSLATFATVFSSYVIVNRVQEAILSFEVMDQYGVARNTVSLNSLLRAMCREGKTQQAKDYLEILKDKIRVDAETYAVLLEGWESEGDVGKARQTFSEMVVDIGWDTKNMLAYDSFLCTLLKGPDGMHEDFDSAEKLLDEMVYNGAFPDSETYGLLFHFLIKQRRVRDATPIFKEMVKNEFVPMQEDCSTAVKTYIDAGDPHMGMK